METITEKDLARLERGGASVKRPRVSLRERAETRTQPKLAESSQIQPEPAEDQQRYLESLERLNQVLIQSLREMSAQSTSQNAQAIREAVEAAAAMRPKRVPYRATPKRDKAGVIEYVDLVPIEKE